MFTLLKFLLAIKIYPHQPHSLNCFKIGLTLISIHGLKLLEGNVRKGCLAQGIAVALLVLRPGVPHIIRVSLQSEQFFLHI